MPKANALVDGVIGLSPSTITARGSETPEKLMTVEFQGGNTGFLDMTQPRSTIWSEVLTSLSQSNSSVYVEINPKTQVITNLLCPIAVRVGALTPTASGEVIEVELIISHKRHYLRRSNPDFSELLATLETAIEQESPVLVTESLEANEIIDIRLIPKSLVPEFTLTETPEEEVSPLAAISLSRAQQLFNLVNSKICCPATAPDPCIPFLYPDDGCWGRAHEMRRLMLLDGVSCDKIWIYGSLQTKTANNPNCRVLWGWHVAPTLLVNLGSSNQSYVIDPSLFNEPVTPQVWKSVQGDVNASLEPSTGAVFYRSRGGTVIDYDDAAYSKTKQVLNTYRNQLKLRTASAAGPPPYIPCLTKPSGVQWFGTIAPNVTARWFTYGWPANWHIVWTIMPLTPCPGKPQLSWTVQVERANSTQCTYWISVNNLTGETVRFEGRYDILSQ